MRIRKRFTSENSAKDFAGKVAGQVNDLRGVKGAKSNFTVTYKKQDKTIFDNDWCPEEDRDFGYPNEYWK